MCLWGFLFLFLFFFQKGINELSSQHLFGKRSKLVWNCIFMHVFFFLSDISASSSIIKGRNTPGKPVREVSEIQAHSHGFCLSHPAFCVWRLCKTCVRARACMYYTCHHLRMVVTSPLAAYEEHSSNVHCHCHHHDNRTRGWGNRNLFKMATLCSP